MKRNNGKDNKNNNNNNNGKIYFVGAGPGDPELLTVKGKSLIERADFILYTGSLVPRPLLKWRKENAIVKSSFKLSYEKIYDFMEKHANKGIFVRLHTGDPSIYSTIAKQIIFLKEKGISYEVVPGVTSASAAAAACNIEYTLPGTSQTLILSRITGNTANPEPLINLLQCKHSSFVFYLSITLIDTLAKESLKLYDKTTPCWVVEKASWKEGQRIIKGDISSIQAKVKEANIKGIALILFGNFLNQEENASSYLYNEEKESYEKTWHSNN